MNRMLKDTDYNNWRKVQQSIPASMHMKPRTQETFSHTTQKRDRDTGLPTHHTHTHARTQVSQTDRILNPEFNTRQAC